MKLAKQPMAKSTASFARVRIQKAGLNCDDDARTFKILDKDAQKYMVPIVLKQSDSANLVDKVAKGNQMKKIRKAEEAVIEHIERKEEIANKIKQDNAEYSHISHR